MMESADTMAAIRRRYTEVGFASRALASGDGVVFENDFSVHVVFLVGRGFDLMSNWRTLHRQVERVYRDFEGFEDLEWSFYCVFVLPDSTSANDVEELRAAIGSDTYYSRKIILRSSEVELLPLGRFEFLMDKRVPHGTDAVATWAAGLGTVLYDKVVASRRAEMKNMLLEHVQGEVASDAN